jgi:cation diffusion facilitator CzcD-associated flavoprotein CzcO
MCILCNHSPCWGLVSGAEKTRHQVHDFYKSIIKPFYEHLLEIEHYGISKMAVSETNGKTPDLAFLAQKYEEERQKRLRPDGNNQYIDLEVEAPSHLASLIEDPWVDHAALNAQPPNLVSGDHVKLVILGTGIAGLLHAARFIEQGFSPDDIRLVDEAGGFGGAWYWNRYPGITCDSESCIYLPLLEETEYVPKNRYSHGDEIREHAVRIAEQYRFSDKAVFRTHVHTMAWQDDEKRWSLKMTQNRGPEEQSREITITAQFLVLGSGLLLHPKIPKLEGLGNYQGEMIHTARWKYNISGGSPTNPTLTGLQGKKVGFIGTGATGVQCVTELAKWAGHLYVFQRTPSSVAERGQRPMDREEWDRVASKPGWWTERNANFVSNTIGEPVEQNLVNDEWTRVDTYHVLVGSPERTSPLEMKDVPGQIGKMMAIDAPRGEKLRKRVTDIVEDAQTAENLKAWFPAWCKRPCFHDHYLQNFNRENVTLVRTEPTGVGKASSKGVVVEGKEYDLDVIVFGTGYRAPSTDIGEPSKLANATITGVGGVSIAKKWLEDGPATLHGSMASSFPNLFFCNPVQSSVSASMTYLFDIKARHASQVVAAALSQSSNPDKLVLEPEAEAEEAWTNHLASMAAWFAPLSICLPNFLNNEGAAVTDMKEAAKLARAMPYPLGINAFAKCLEEWRAEGSFKGLRIR